MSVYPTSALSQFKENERGSFMNTEEINPHLTAKIVVNYMRHHRLVFRSNQMIQRLGPVVCG